MKIEEKFFRVRQLSASVFVERLKSLTFTALIHARVSVARRGRDWRKVRGLS